MKVSDLPAEGWDRAKPTTAGSGSFQISSPDYDVFIDLSGSGLGRPELWQHLEALALNAGLTSASGSVTVVLSEECNLPPFADNWQVVSVDGLKTSDALYSAIGRAADSNRHLVVVLGSLLPTNEVLRHLIEHFDIDPLFGTAQPRFANASSDHVWLLPDHKQADPEHPTLTRAGLSVLPPCIITPELLAACMAIRREVVREMEQSDHGSRSTIGELRLLLCQARRRGYRNLVVNHAVLPSQLSYARVYPLPPSADIDQLRSMHPDIVRADAWTANLSQRKLEAILSSVYADHPMNRRRLLLDCRGMGSQHNGTCHNILGLLDGFHTLGGMWQVDIVVSPVATEFHRLRERYPGFTLLHDRPVGAYTAGVLLNQPWGLSTIADLHDHALILAFNILDTIAWDILYVADESLDSLWRFVARFSDGLFYNSQFTRDRFKARFPLQAQIAERVTYLSCSAEEQINPAAAQEPLGEHILVFGNNYDHKDVARTARILTDAFPFNKVVAIGLESVAAPGILTMPSGQIEETELHRLMASARVIVFPSFYEGFGIPVVQGLAYGRPVIVRKSPLWHEIAEQLRSPGQLVPFDSITSLVEAVGCVLVGLPLKPLPQGRKLGADESPLRWRDCAQRIMGLVEELMSNADTRRWKEREEALQAIRLLRS